LRTIEFLLKIVRSLLHHHNRITTDIFAHSPFVGECIEIEKNL